MNFAFQLECLYLNVTDVLAESRSRFTIPYDGPYPSSVKNHRSEFVIVSESGMQIDNTTTTNYRVRMAVEMSPIVIISNLRRLVFATTGTHLICRTSLLAFGLYDSAGDFGCVEG
jgi:hypothetical protein